MNSYEKIILFLFIIICVIGCILLILLIENDYIKLTSISVLGIGIIYTIFKYTGKTITGGKEMYEMNIDEINNEIISIKKENDNIIGYINYFDNINSFDTDDEKEIYLGLKALKPIYNINILKQLQETINYDISNNPSFINKIKRTPNKKYNKEYYNVSDIEQLIKSDNKQKNRKLLNSNLFKNHEIFNKFINDELKLFGLNASSISSLNSYLPKYKDIIKYNDDIKNKSLTDITVDDSVKPFYELIETHDLNKHDFDTKKENSDKVMESINLNNYRLFKLYRLNKERIIELEQSTQCVDCFSKIKHKIVELETKVSDYQNLKTKLDEYILKDLEFSKIQDELVARIKELKDINIKNTERIFEHSKEIESLEKELSILRKEKDILEKEKNEIKSINDSKDEKIKDLLKNIIQKDNEIDKCKKDIELINITKNSIAEQVEINVKTIEEKNNDIDKLNDIIVDLQYKLSEYKNKEIMFNKQKKDLDDKMTNLYEEEYNLNDRYTKLIKEHNTVKKELETKTSEFKLKEDELNEKIEDLELNDKTELYNEHLKILENQNKSVEKLNYEIIKLKERIFSIENERNNLINTLNNTKETIDGYIDDLSIELKSINKKIKSNKKMIDSVDFKNMKYTNNEIDIINNTKRDIILLENEKEGINMTIKILGRFSSKNDIESSDNIIDRGNDIKKLIEENTKLSKDSFINEQKIQDYNERIKEINELKTSLNTLYLSSSKADLLNNEIIKERDGYMEEIKLLNTKIIEYDNEKKLLNDKIIEYEELKKKYSIEKESYDKQLQILENDKKSSNKKFINNFNIRLISLINKIDNESLQLIKEIKQSDENELNKNASLSKILTSKIEKMVEVNKSFQSNLDIVNEEIADLRTKLTMSMQQNDKLTIEIEKYKIDIENKQNEFNNLNKINEELSDLNKKLNDINNDNQGKDHEIEKLKNMIISKELELDNYISNNKELITDNTSFIEHLGNYTKKVFSLMFSTNEVDEKTNELTNIKDISNKFNLIFNIHKTFIENKNNEIIKLENDIKNSNNINKADKNNLQSTINDINIKLTTYRKEFDGLELKLGLCKSEVLRKNDEIEQLNKSNVELSNEIIKVNKESQKIIDEQLLPLKKEYNEKLESFIKNNFTVGTALKDKDNALKERDIIKNKLKIEQDSNKLILKELEIKIKELNNTITNNSNTIESLKKTIESNTTELDKIILVLNEIKNNTILLENYEIIRDIIKDTKKTNIDKLIIIYKETEKQLFINKEINNNNKKELDKNRKDFDNLQQDKNKLVLQLTNDIENIKNELSNNKITHDKFIIEYKSMEENILKLQSDNIKLNIDVNDCINRLQIKEDEIISLKNNNEILSKDQKNEFKLNLTRLENEKKTIKEESEILSNNLTAKIKSLNDLITNSTIMNENSINELNDNIKNLTLLNTNISINNNKLTDDIIRLKNEQNILIEKYNRLETKDNTTNEDLLKCNKDKDELVNKYNLNKNTLNTIENELIDYKNKLQDEINKNSNSNILNISLHEKNIELEKSIFELTSNNNVMLTNITKLENELQSIKYELDNTMKSKSNNSNSNKILITFLKSKIQKLETKKTLIEESLMNEIDKLNKNKIILENQIINVNTKLSNSLEISNKYDDLLSLYNNQLKSSKEMSYSLDICNSSILKCSNELTTCSSNLLDCSNELKTCKLSLNEKEIFIETKLINENKQLKQRIIELENVSETNKNYGGDEIIILDSQLLNNNMYKNTKKNTISKIIDNDKYTNFLKKNIKI